MNRVATNGTVENGSKSAAGHKQLRGSNFVVDYIVLGEDVQCVLARAQHQARPSSCSEGELKMFPEPLLLCGRRCNVSRLVS